MPAEREPMLLKQRGVQLGSYPNALFTVVEDVDVA